MSGMEKRRWTLEYEFLGEYDWVLVADGPDIEDDEVVEVMPVAEHCENVDEDTATWRSAQTAMRGRIHTAMNDSSTHAELMAKLYSMVVEG